MSPTSGPSRISISCSIQLLLDGHCQCKGFYLSSLCQPSMVLVTRLMVKLTKSGHWQARSEH